MTSPDGRYYWDGYQWLPVGAPAGPRRTSPLAVASLVASLAFPLWPLSSIAAVVLGSLALRRLRESPHLGGRAMAIAGIVVGVAVLALVAIAVALVAYFGYECRNGC